ncbi:hypothetical protein DFP72DRAFT_1171365 [Ephemerocybe angulata]|uniref:Uncharacterized protein n=1 Tax=Ephemerocybe angulata TaxID=980116 RepID=A0A8H6HW10_9AGAR|nr:hypothetical protein DFP72DRAFT_1171365 [Tulosesus angulatus]
MLQHVASGSAQLLRFPRDISGDTGVWLHELDKRPWSKVPLHQQDPSLLSSSQYSPPPPSHSYSIWFPSSSSSVPLPPSSQLHLPPLLRLCRALLSQRPQWTPAAVPNVRRLVDADVDADVLGLVDVDVDVDLKKRCPTGGCTGGPTTITAIIADVNAELGPIVADIEAAIAVSAGVSAKVDIKVVLALLVKIQVLLAAALADIKLCALVGGLVNTVLQVLVVVIRGCGGIHIDLQVCIRAIIVLCADILSVCIVALPAVKVLLAVLLKTVCITLGTLGAEIVALTQCLSL